MNWAGKMAEEDEIYQRLMQNHASKVTGAQTPQNAAMPAQGLGAPKGFEKDLIYKMFNPVNEALTQTRPGAALTGMGEGVWENIASIGNLFREDENKIGSLGSEGHINPELGGYHQGGKLAGNLLSDYLALRGVGTTLRGATGIGGLAARAAASSGAGYAMGEHFPEWLGGRAGAATLGALFPITAGATSGEIGKNVVRAAEQAESKYGPKIGEAVAKSGPMSKIGVAPGNGMLDILSGEIKLSTESGGKKLLQELIQNPSAAKAQKTLSALKAEQRGMLSHTHPKATNLPDASKRTYDAIGETIQTLEKNIKKGMSPEVFKEYKDALRGYAGKVGPYKQPAIEGARKGTGPAKNIPKAIAQMEKYSQTLPAEEGAELMNQFQYLMKQHPELWVNKYNKKVGGAGVLGLGLNEAANYFKSLFENQNTGYE